MLIKNMKITYLTYFVVDDVKDCAYSIYIFLHKLILLVASQIRKIPTWTCCMTCIFPKTTNKNM